MIVGQVAANLDAIVRPGICDVNSQVHDVEFVVDTGFTARLTLMPALVQSLGLPWVARSQVMLADGSVQFLDRYEATVIWDGQARVMEIIAVDGSPLLGMRALRGHDVRIAVVPGGRVEIEAIP